MKQFYEAYKDNKKLAPALLEIDETPENKALTVQNEKLPTLLAEISWSHNIEIFSRCKVEEEKEFYIRLCIEERLSFRELQRQINTSSFERVMTADDGLSPALNMIAVDPYQHFR